MSPGCFTTAARATQLVLDVVCVQITRCARGVLHKRFYPCFFWVRSSYGFLNGQYNRLLGVDEKPREHGSEEAPPVLSEAGYAGGRAEAFKIYDVSSASTGQGVRRFLAS